MSGAVWSLCFTVTILSRVIVLSALLYSLPQNLSFVREMEQTCDLAVPLDVESSDFVGDWLEGFTLCNMESCDLVVPLGVEPLVSWEVGWKVICLVFLMV
jgi:hypothetical protein